MADRVVEEADAGQCQECHRTNVPIRRLRCKHAFCTTCLRRILVSTAEHSMARKITCPLCNDDHRLPKGGSLDVVTCSQTGEMHTSGEPSCTRCHKGKMSVTKDAVLCCVTCSELMCRRCAQLHEAKRSSPNHVTVSINDDVIDAIFCAECCKRLVRFFCPDDFRMVCCVCARNSHADHVIVDLTVDADPEQYGRTSIPRNLERVFRDLKTKRNALDDARGRCRKALEATKKEITTRLWRNMELIQKRLQEQERRLHEQIDDYYALIEKRCSEQRRLIDGATSLIAELRKVANAIQKPFGTDARITAFPVEWFQERFTRIQLPTWNADRPLGAARYVPGDDWMDLGHVILREVFETDDDDDDCRSTEAKARLLWQADADNVVDVGFVDDSDPGVVYSSFDDLSTAAGRFDVVKLHIADGSPTELPVLVPGSSKQFCAIGTDYRCTQCVVLTKADVDDDVIDGRRADWDAVVVQGDSVTCCTLRDEWPPGGEPVAIAIDGSGNLVVATLAEPNRQRGATSLRCYHRRGHALWCRSTTVPPGGRPDDDPASLLTPWDLCVDAFDRIVVADAEQRCVKIFDRRGDHLTTFRIRTAHDPGRPVAVCTNELTEIFVAYYDGRIMSRFTANGQFIGHVIKTGHTPKAIAYNNKRFIVATKKKIKLYQLPSS